MTTAVPTENEVTKRVPLRIYSTCPQSRDIEPARYLQAVADVSRWSEAAGCEGMLVYTDNGFVDPWVVSQAILANTERLKPLVAVQPVYMHPYTATKMITSLGFIHGRAVDLNMVAGGYRKDLQALGDETSHDERYDRVVEYSQILMDLLRGAGPVTVHGRYYRVERPRLAPQLPPELLPEIFMSGSSPAWLAASRRLGVTAVKCPQPPGEEEPWIDGDSARSFGVRVGVIAREDAGEAWQVALERFPEDRQGRIINSIAMRLSDSQWHQELSRSRDEITAHASEEPDPYWLGPFRNYKTYCPYLVGSYERVGQTLAGYIAAGCLMFIVDVPASEEDFKHTGIVFERAREVAPV